MAQDRFLIAPLNSGLQNNVKPWLIPDDAYFKLANAYVWRGRVRKRWGALPTASYVNNLTTPDVVLASRFRINIGTTDAAGNFTGSAPAGTVAAIGQAFSVGTGSGRAIFTVDILGAPAALLASKSGTSGDYDAGTLAVNITAGIALALTDVYFYPALPVCGFANLEDPELNFEPTLGFDTTFAYVFTGNQWTRSGTLTWTGTSQDLFWSTNYRGEDNQDTILFVSNNIAADGISYYNGATWARMMPELSAGYVMWTARVIIPFKDVLVALNTQEGLLASGAAAADSFVNRARWCQNGNPIYDSGSVDPNVLESWRDDIAGRGSYLDATTKEAIVTALILKDRLIVYFESSTWELVYTGNAIQPFRWQQINIELGAESTFSIVPFDKVLLGVGNVGIHACNGANVERIDDLIPSQIFDIRNAEAGVERVAGIRDYYTELVYWSLPNGEFNVPGLSDELSFNNMVLVYNYKTGSWAQFDDSITAFGYFQRLNSFSGTWASANLQWKDNQNTWGDIPNNKRFRNIVCGNQQGFTFLVAPDVTKNAPSLQITSMSQLNPTTIDLVVINNNLFEFGRGDFEVFIHIEDAVSDGADIQITDAYGTRDINGNNFKAYLTGLNSIAIDGVLSGGSYKGGGNITRVSGINIYTKEYNFYVNQGMNAYVDRIDFQINRENIELNDDEERINQAEIMIDYRVSTSSESMVEQGQATQALIGSSILDLSPYELVPFENSSERLWHPVYLQADGEFIQIRIYYSDEELYDPFKATAGFTLHSFIVYAQPAALRLQ